MLSPHSSLYHSEYTMHGCMVPFHVRGISSFHLPKKCFCVGFFSCMNMYSCNLLQIEDMYFEEVCKQQALHVNWASENIVKPLEQEATLLQWKYICFGAYWREIFFLHVSIRALDCLAVLLSMLQLSRSNLLHPTICLRLFLTTFHKGPWCGMLK